MPINSDDFVPYVPPTICPLCKQPTSRGQHMRFFDTGCGQPSWGCRVEMYIRYPGQCATISDIGEP